ncbi:hypothetical protein ACOME3_010331 [Neoechinorhynchus agilis]
MIIVGIINSALAVWALICADSAVRWEVALMRGPHNAEYRANRPVNFTSSVNSAPRRYMVGACAGVSLLLGIELFFGTFYKFNSSMDDKKDSQSDLTRSRVTVVSA